MAILIVDDTRSIRALMEYHLLSAGYAAVLHASTARECFALLGLDGADGTQVPATLVLMDLQLPDTNGIDALRRIKASSRLAGVPVLLVTSDLSGADREAALAAGADGFIDKPLNRDAFIARVRDALSTES